jgi:hypothetical protein
MPYVLSANLNSAMSTIIRLLSLLSHGVRIPWEFETVARPNWAGISILTSRTVGTAVKKAGLVRRLLQWAI